MTDQSLEDSDVRSDGPDSVDDVDVGLDTVCGILANARRRSVLSCLRASDGPMALADVAEEVAARELDGPTTGDVPQEVVERVYALLHHLHLPKMADAEVVTYDRDGGVVALGENAEQASSLVESLSRE